MNWKFIAAATLMMIAGSAQAQTTLTSDGFEGSLGNWTNTAGATLYTYTSGGTNWASTGTGAANLPKSSGAITLINSLPLNTQGFTNLTINFDFKWLNGTSTRFLNLNYAADGTNFITVGRVTSSNGGTPTTFAHATLTLREGISGSQVSNMTAVAGYTGGLFTDTAKFQFVDVASAGADVRVFVDNIQITGIPIYVIPEPSTAMLILSGVGGLVLVMRRRARAKH